MPTSDENTVTPSKPSLALRQTVLFGGLVLAGLFGAQNVEVLVIEKDEFLMRLLATLMTTFAIALLLERATEVLIAILCGTEEMEINVTRRKKAEMEQSLIDREKAVLATLTSAEERMTYLTTGRGAERLSTTTARDEESFAQSAGRLVQLKTRKMHVSTIALTVLGGIVAMGGLRLLDATVDFGQLSAGQTQQLMLLRGLDVVVTTLVLGGGARGIHEIIQRLKPE